MANFPTKNEHEFNKFLVREYLKHGSVDDAIAANNHSLPISIANYHRILDKWGIVKTAGPNNKLTEVINFLYKMVDEQVPLDKLYKKMPPSFKTSAVTLYRVLSYIKEGITRRIATGLIIHPSNDKYKVLVAKDKSTPRLSLGKPFGAITIPMTFSRLRDGREVAIKRVLQQEVFTELTIDEKFPNIVVPDNPRPFMFLDIADIRVEIFDISLPKKMSKMNYFSSFKLEGFKFVDISEDKIITKHKDFRVGVSEAIKGYKKYLKLKKRNLSFNPLLVRTDLNYFLAEQD